MRALLLVTAAAIAAACSPEHPDAQTTSLVGATKLPRASALDKETILISKEGGKDGRDVLNIELLPDNRLEISHTVGSGPVRPDETLVGKELGSVNAETAKQIRRMLWRIRPENDADVRKTVPLGCTYIFDAASEAEVWFVTKGKVLPEIFILPLRQDCQSKSWQQASNLLTSALELLPPSKIIREFPALS